MGRAIDMENKLDALEIRLKLVEDAFDVLLLRCFFPTLTSSVFFSLLSIT